MTDPQPSLNGDTPPTSSGGRIDAITGPLHLPPFWNNDPQLWFGQVEAQFTARHLTSQATKFGHVLAALPPEVALEIRDIILSPPAERPYDVLKEELIRRTAASEQRRLHQLLNAEELGDRKPTQLLRRMRQLLGDNSTDTPLLKQLFLKRLPTQVQMVLAAAGSISLEEQALLADKILDLADPATQSFAAEVSSRPSEHEALRCRHDPPPICRYERPPPAASADTILATVTSFSSSMQQLQASINNLTQMMAALVTQDRPRSPSPNYRRHRNPRRHASRRRFQSPNGQSCCWYHATFGPAARHCQPPCSWPGNAPTGDQ